MKSSRFSAAILGISVLGLTASTWAQSDYMPPMSGWPAAIQTAWQVQGEYYGSQVADTTQHVGAWVITRGGTNYSLVILPGGLLTLPGQPYGGWNPVNTRYQGASGPATLTLNGTIFNVTTSTGGFTSDSLTGTGENRTLYVHTSSARYILKRVKLGERHSPTLGLRSSQVGSLVPTGSTLVPLFDSTTGAADLTKWAASENAVQLKYGQLYRGIKTNQKFGRYFLHAEFLSCFNPTATGQGRANSGLYTQGRYESQVLDSYGLSGAIDEYGGLYSIKAPSVNAELPPQITYQTYDIYFTPRTGTGTSVVPGYFTVYANGVKVQDSTVATVTGTGAFLSLGTTDEAIYLQNHGNEVIFANIWAIVGSTVTTQSLPYSSVLAAGGTTAIQDYAIKPFSRTNSLKVLGFDGNYNMIGRQIKHNGNTLSIQPTVMVNPKNP